MNVCNLTLWPSCLLSKVCPAGVSNPQMKEKTQKANDPGMPSILLGPASHNQAELAAHISACPPEMNVF